MSSGMISNAEAFELIKRGTRANTVDLLERIAILPAELAPSFKTGLLITAVAHGTLDGVVTWMVAHLGVPATYEILQRRADALAAGVINLGSAKK